jgi:hypothetical protein
MKRIKSAPANIAEMVNRKKPTSEKSPEKIILIIPKPEEPEKENTYNDFSKQIVHLKNQKIIEKTFNSIMIDYINDKQVLNSNDEEALILSILYYYFCEKIFTKNNLREFIRFITQTLIKYVFAHMLNDVLINNKDILIQQITHINHL